MGAAMEAAARAHQRRGGAGAGGVDIAGSGSGSMGDERRGGLGARETREEMRRQGEGGVRRTDG